jgi:ADP-ribose pyrophosphatase YjhB (NUDIX family)
MHNFIEKMKDNSNGKVVTFDFDGTIMKSFMNRTFEGEENFQFGGVNQKVIDKLRSYKRAGFTVFIVSSRKIHFDAEEYSIDNNLRMLQIEVDGIFYTNGNMKAQKLYELGSMMHYDDDPEERKEIEKLKKIYPDFNITVRDPEELLEDINEIAKGIIITSDYKFVIAQRSDSYEWDAPGGHIQEGEEPVYAFWRETKEELGLELEEIRFLDEQITTWKGEDKKFHYYFGFTPFEAKELEDNIDLQWEVAAYFCGTLQDILNKVKGNATQNLVNVLKLIESQQNMLESY